MNFLFPSFLAGVLTVLAPCVLTLLPVILGGTLGSKDRLRPLVIIASLAISMIVFSLLLKGSTLFIGIPDQFWKNISGGILLAFGFVIVVPSIWEKAALKLGLYKSEILLHKSQEKGGAWGTVLLGASLGPVFTTCSPTYSIILAVILPSSFWIGFINLLVYALGLAIVLFLIAYGGQSITRKLRFAANPHGWFKKMLGALLLLTGILVLTGLDKRLESVILDTGYLGPIGIERQFLPEE